MEFISRSMVEHVARIRGAHVTLILRYAVHVHVNGGTWFWDALHLEYNDKLWRNWSVRCMLHADYNANIKNHTCNEIGFGDMQRTLMGCPWFWCMCCTLLDDEIGFWDMQPICDAVFEIYRLQHMFTSMTGRECFAMHRTLNTTQKTVAKLVFEIYVRCRLQCKHQKPNTRSNWFLTYATHMWRGFWDTCCTLTTLWRNISQKPGMQWNWFWRYAIETHVDGWNLRSESGKSVVFELCAAICSTTKLVFEICDPHVTQFLRYAAHVHGNVGTWWFGDALHLEYNARNRG